MLLTGELRAGHGACSAADLLLHWGGGGVHHIADRLSEGRRSLRPRQGFHRVDQRLLPAIRMLKKQPVVLDRWDQAIWTVIVEEGIVHRDGWIMFVFYNGTEITVGAE